jgi:hypothetical protein
MSRDGAIFVVGSSRSGTNLLRAILNKHSRVWLAGETHYFDDLRPRLGDGAATPLAGAQRAEAERYFLALAHRPYGYGGDPGGSALDPDELRELAGKLGGSGDAYLEAYCILQARRRDKPVWAEKTPRHVFRIDEIVAAFPDAKVVCLIRDPRAVIASNRDWHRAKPADGAFADARAADRERTKRSYNIVLASLLWRSAVRSAQAAYRGYGPDRIRLLSFERLAGDPTAELPPLCEWLGLEYEPGMLEIQVVNSSYESGDATGVSAEPVDRWRSKLSDQEIAIVQRYCGSLMDELGYEQLPVHASPLQLAWAGASLVPATVRAGVANRARLGRVTEYVRRRAAPAFSR